MSVVKRVNKKADESGEDFVGDLKTNMKRRGAYSSALTEQDIQNEIVNYPGDQVYVHNASKGEFHVPPLSNKPDTDEEIEIFEVNEVRLFDKAELLNKRFKKCFSAQTLKIVTEEQTEKIREEHEKELKKSLKGSGKKTRGLAASGLPNSLGAALAYIATCEDPDELEGFLQNEERENLVEIISDRIDELEEKPGYFKG